MSHRMAHLSSDAKCAYRAIPVGFLQLQDLRKIFTAVIGLV